MILRRFLTKVETLKESRSEALGVAETLRPLVRRFITFIPVKELESATWKYLSLLTLGNRAANDNFGIVSRIYKIERQPNLFQMKTFRV